ncbi:hypothetical protein E2C01_087851 [Portunus trituberculatus]|uniref:Uncharacterized protein n=1 Tax=Portunus trituberculatus TaxID=210409 RepID=A0A5B7JDL6_PORTR|nr:hypothetical protein [Portunus trituberculatus]
MCEVATMAVSGSSITATPEVRGSRCRCRLSSLSAPLPHRLTATPTPRPASIGSITIYFQRF